ncbi:BCAS2 family protein [Talaromyces stipitatus ATCC 10500]|uniref:BCAS2 family protein n=1 Tax=Talaromyces stipitatus (strain ATCC 10500 / CBS 375.48 / QM 6759 / NRRL 1006) TaxID=441959 RepID=B8LUN5_TALSN|nr:BCAS2 family protein [Talaromyces stipitatus ATCC 10500]EED23892.1 BCAS2 family protein [Talaromyces stipitatus ATCC 10500]
MPLINEYHSSLPYIDGEPGEQARATAQKLISAELSPEHASTLHPAIPALPETRFSPLIEQELSRKEAGLPLTGGIDLSRYEAPEAPEGPSKTQDEASKKLQEWKDTLRKAYISSSHLSIRHNNLSLLEEYGKNAWLIGNSQLEEILRNVEKELAETKEAVENVHKERKLAQESGHGELSGLEDTWRRGVGSVLEVEVAAEHLRQQILEQRRQQAQQSR